VSPGDALSKSKGDSFIQCPANPVPYLLRLVDIPINYLNPWRTFTAFCENLYTWAIIWTYNPVSLTRRQFGRMVRCHLWLTRKGLLALVEGESGSPGALRKTSHSPATPPPPQ